MKTTWIEGQERRQIMASYAERLWTCRDSAVTYPGGVHFGSCSYVETASSPNEFDSGSSALRDGTVEYRMTMVPDAMTATVDAVAAYRILGSMTTQPPSLPSSIELPVRTPPVRHEPSMSTRMARFFGFQSAPVPAAPDVISDPRSVARYELGRAVHTALFNSRAHPQWGQTRVRVTRGIFLDVSNMIVYSDEHGDARLYPSWYEPVRDLMKAAQLADPVWVAGRDKSMRHHTTTAYVGDGI